MKTKALYMVGLLIAAGCSNSGGKGGFDPSNPETYKEVQDITVKNSKQFESKGDVKIDSDYMNEAYTHGCKAIGSSEKAMTLDPALRAGDQIYKSMHRRTQKITSAMEFKTEIISISGNAKETKNTTLSMNIKEAGGEILKQPMVAKSTCKGMNVSTDPSGTQHYSEDCTTTAPGQEDAGKYLTDNGIRFWNSTSAKANFDCKVETKHTETSKVERGLFDLQGTKIKAFRHIHRSNGDVVCNGRYVGKGSVENVSIVSNDVLTDSYWSCGGESVSHSETIRLGEKVIESFKTEILSARIR